MSSDFFETNAGLTPIEDHLSGMDYAVARGFTSDLVNQLVYNSRQDHIIDATPDDMRGRFKDRSAFETWWNDHEGIAAYMLLADNAVELAGIVWHHPASLLPSSELIDPEKTELLTANHTFGVRIYEPHRGRRLARPFMQACLQDYVQQPQVVDNFEGIWLRTSDSSHNLQTRELYGRFGYERYAVSADKSRVTMVLSAERAAQIQHASMGLG